MHYLNFQQYSEKEVKENFFNFIRLAIAMMTASKNEFFVGSFEIQGTKPTQDVPIELLFFKDKKYIPYMIDHIKYTFKREFSFDELNEIINKKASIKKKYADHILISFYPFFKAKKPISYFSTEFYNEIKKKGVKK